MERFYPDPDVFGVQGKIFTKKERNTRARVLNCCQTGPLFRAADLVNDEVPLVVLTVDTTRLGVPE